MALSSTVLTGDQGTAAQYNNLRTDALNCREIFATVHFGVTGGVAGVTAFGATISQVGDEARAQLIVPQGFTSIVELEVIFHPHETGASMHFDITTYFGAYNGGEDYNAGSETENARDIGATVNNQHVAHDISDLVTGLAAGDILQIYVEYDATAVDSNATVKGLRLKYL